MLSVTSCLSCGRGLSRGNKQRGTISLGGAIIITIIILIIIIFIIIIIIIISGPLMKVSFVSPKYWAIKLLPFLAVRSALQLVFCSKRKRLLADRDCRLRP